MKTEKLNTTIHPGDPMLPAPKGKNETAQYVRIGESALEIIKNVLNISRNQGVEAVLDLPCGYGRIGRHLRAEFPDARIDFADLVPEMADFCAENFSGNPLYSKEDLTQVFFPVQYDVIWVGSLFTHIDFYRVETWTRHLCEALKPDGVLVATFHGAWSFEYQKRVPMCSPQEWEEIVAGYNSLGYGYAPYRSRGIDSVGISLAKPSTIVNMVGEIEGVRLLSYTERGWANNHDVLGLTKKDRLFFEPGWEAAGVKKD